jgi:GAF domain-containing protein
MNLYKDILKKALEIIHSEGSAKDKMQTVCDLLEDQIEYYDWVGFYLSDVESRMLRLGPYTGEETDHTTIPYGKGICGQAAESEKTFLIDDVDKESNYIVCSIHVKSEIVVPIFRDGIVIGQIDIDSDEVAAFKKDDQELLEYICSEIAPFI